MAEQREWTERDKRINRILYGIAIAWWVIGLGYIYLSYAPVRKAYKTAVQQSIENEKDHIDELAK